MGFRNGAYATVWSVKSITNKITEVNLSISRKNKQDQKYETDFSGTVRFLGTSTANRALQLKRQDRIQLGDVDVSAIYDKDKKREYITYKVFSFDTVDNNHHDNGELKDLELEPSGDLDPVDEDGEPLPF